MKKSIHTLLMAAVIVALPFMFTSCEDLSDDNGLNPAGGGKPMPFSATISTPAGTRGLTEATDGKSISAKWEKGEQIALIHGKSVDVMTVKSVDDKGVATIEGTINNATEGEEVHVVYMGVKGMDAFKTKLNAALEAESSEKPISKPLINYAVEKTFGDNPQLGTFEAINDKLDYRYASSTLTCPGSVFTFKTVVTPTSQLAVWKLSLSGTTDKPLFAQELKVWDGDNPLALVKPEKATSEMYVVVPAVTSASLLITATTDGSDYYALNKPSLTLQAGYFYKSSVKLNSNAEILGAALDEGALVSIAYTVDGVSYTSTFMNMDGEYVEQPTTSDSRALTRASSNILAQLHEFHKTINIQVIKDNKVVLNAEINSNDGAYAETFGDGAELKGAAVNGISAFIINKCKKTMTIRPEGGGEGVGSINYIDGETWSDLYDKQSKNGHMIIQINGEKVLLSNGKTWQLYKDAGCNSPVLPDDKITQDVYAKLLPITYQEASWNESEKIVDNITVSTNEYTIVSLSTVSSCWFGGTYVVKSNVSIPSGITLIGNVNLILCDGATLTVNGQIYGNGYTLTIYGQSSNTGNLVVVSGGDGIQDFSKLTIHGGNITVKSKEVGIFDTPMTVYGGKLSIEAIEAITTGAFNDMTVYGGEVEAISTSGSGINLGEKSFLATLTVFGGKVTAEGNPAIKGNFVAGEGTNIKFFGCNDNVSWTPITNTSDYRYFYADVEAPASNSSPTTIN